MEETVIVLDFGGQYNQLIARRVREQNVYCELLPCTTPVEKLLAKQPKGIIFTGGPNSVYGENAPRVDRKLLEAGIPVLGICYGCQLIAHTLGGKVQSADTREYGKQEIRYGASPLFAGIPERAVCWMSHTDRVTEVPAGFEVLADTETCSVAAMGDAAEVISSMQAALQDNNFTSIALVSYFGQEGKRKAEEILPFTSANKYSAVRFSDATYLLGAPEFVMKERSEELETLIHGYSSQGLRVLLLGRTAGGIAEDKVSGEVEAMGLVTLSDNIRDDTIETIQWFKDNDVSIRVISGDNPLTVSEVAKRAGIDGAEKWISLEGMSPEQVVAVANSYTVFGRVTPDQKAVLVRAIKAAGNTVAMTGDGVNDILALKDADCAIAMAAGADAAKNVSHLVLMDSKFSSMPRVVEEGRKVINNIQRSSSLFLMKTVFTVLLSIGIICTPGVAYPFSPKNLVLMEVCVIGFPSFVLALEPNRERIKGHFLTQTFSKAIPNGLILLASVIAMLVYNSFIEVSPEELEAMCVLALSFVSFWLLIDLCIPINWIRAAMLAAMAGVCVFIIGVMPGFIGLVPLNVDEMLVISVVVLACYPAGQILNYISRFVFKTIDEHRHARRKEGKSE